MAVQMSPFAGSYSAGLAARQLVEDCDRVSPGIRSTIASQNVVEMCREIREHAFFWAHHLRCYGERSVMFYPKNVSAHESLPRRETVERAVAVRHSEELIAGGAISDEPGRADMPSQLDANGEKTLEHLPKNSALRPLIVTCAGDVFIVLKKLPEESIQKTVHFQTGIVSVLAKVKNSTAEQFASMQRVMSYSNDHPAFLKSLGTVRYKNRREEPRFAFLFEHCNIGSFYYGQQILVGPENWEVFRQAVAGVAWLHSHGFVHRDLSSSNLLIHQPAHGKIQAKWKNRHSICSDLDRVRKMQRCTSFRLISPEYAAALRDSQLHSLPHRKSDVWALGVLFWEIVREKPFPIGDSEEEVCQRLLEMRLAGRRYFPYPEGHDPRCDKIFQGTLQLDPELRWSASVLEKELATIWKGLERA